MKLIYTFLIITCFASSAKADPFQFIAPTGAFIANAPVYLDRVLVGYTDSYGRITIKPGGPIIWRSCSVGFKGGWLQKKLAIGGAPQMQKVMFR